MRESEIVRILRLGLWCTLVIASPLLAARAWLGEYAIVRSPMNVEAIVALAALCLLATGNKPLGIRIKPARGVWPYVAALILLLVLAFWPSLSIPLVSDDYYHLLNVTKAGPDFWLDQLTVPQRDPFFRPLGMYSLRLDAMWADHNAFLWRLGNLVPHTLSCVLLFFLGRRLGLSNPAAFFAALFLGWHGSRPESAGWVAARFDLWAGVFLVATLLLLHRYEERPSVVVLSVAMGAALSALLSKESAYVLPVIATVLLWRRVSVRVLGSLYVLTLAIFLYRWSLLGGIGGYQTARVLSFDGLTMVKALLLRLWATLWFPINWRDFPDPLLALALSLMLAAVIGLLWNRPAMNWRALAFVFIAALPVHHLLLIGGDLDGTRVLYLPSMGFALLLAFALDSIGNMRIAVIAGAAILIFQLTALEHNFRVWNRVTQLASRTCQQTAQIIRDTGRDVLFLNLPHVREGVYFLRSGLPECVEWQSGISWTRVEVADRLEDAHGPPNRLVYRWDEQRGTIVEAR
jgi:hypothetical protein